jgi:hypothetical protein
MTSRRKTVIVNLANRTAPAPAPVAAPAQLRKVDAGMYETRDGRYGVVAIESAGEWDTISSEGWAITEGGARDGVELPGTYRTKREAAIALAARLG